MAINIPWTPEGVKNLRRLREEKASYSKIAKVFGKSRGAIASAVRQYCGKKMPQKAIGRKEDGFKNASNILPLLAGACTAKKFLKENQNIIAYPDPRFLSNGYCRAIIGDPRNMCCCGRPTKIEQSFCTEHQKVYYNLTPASEKARLEKLGRIFK